MSEKSGIQITCRTPNTHVPVSADGCVRFVYLSIYLFVLSKLLSFLNFSKSVNETSNASGARKFFSGAQTVYKYTEAGINRYITVPSNFKVTSFSDIF